MLVLWKSPVVTRQLAVFVNFFSTTKVAQTRAIRKNSYASLTRLRRFSFVSEKQPHHPKQGPQPSNQDKQQPKMPSSLTNSGASHQLQQLDADSPSHTIVPRNYNQTSVPGLQTRKYSNLTRTQQQIIQTNKFDIMNPELVPKTGSTSSYAGIQDSLTEISLGAVKIKGNNEVFLSEVDPANIPADLDIRFDTEKELKIVGKQRTRAKKPDNSTTQVAESRPQGEMQVQAETIEQRTIQEHMEQQLGIGLKSFRYDSRTQNKRLRYLLLIMFVACLYPTISTFHELAMCYRTTKQIEEERLKEVVNMKNKSFQKVLFNNKDFNTLKN